MNRALITTRNSYLQFLEGEEVAIKHVFAQREQDSRHTEVEVFFSSTILLPGNELKAIELVHGADMLIPTK